MKRFLYIVLASAIVFAGCTEKRVTTGLTGVQLNLSAGGEYVARSGEGHDVSDFVVTIEKKDGKYSKTWVYSQMPSMVELSTGEFTISVSSPESEPVAWEQPVYGTVKDFTVIGGKITDLTLVCTLQNMKCAVFCSQNLYDKLTDFEVKMSSEDGHLVWSRDDVGLYTETTASDGTKTRQTVKEPSRYAYFAVKQIDINMDGYISVDGDASTANLKYSIKDVAPKDYHMVYIDAYVTGQAMMSLRVDYGVNNRPFDIMLPGINPDDENIDDDIETGWGESDTGSAPDLESTAPYVVWESNPDFTVQTIQSEMDVEMMVYAPETIESFIVRVSENFLPTIQMMIPGVEYLDLINDEAVKANLGNILPTGDQIYGKTEVPFSLSKLVPMIRQVGSAPDQNYVFTLEVTDAKGQKLIKEAVFYNPPME